MTRLLPAALVVASLLPLLRPAAARGQPAEVRRVLRTFDFEERQLGNVEDLPMHWVKVQGPGLPHYVNGKLATDLARNGRYSFRFDLDGGSLLYRYEANQIRVHTGAHYRIEGYVRTTALAHAKARITAYLVDVDGRPVPGTVRYSEPYANGHGDDGWHKLSIELSADSPKAASLVLELGLLQPALYAAPTLGQRTLNAQDVRGSAWFDDLTVAQVPRVAMSTDRPGNVFRRGEAVRMRVTVDDSFTEDLTAQLVVRDAAGKAVFQRSGAIDLAGAEAVGPSRKRASLDLPADLPAGWYQATLVTSSQGQRLGLQALAFIQLADANPPARPDGRFGFVATALPFDGWDELPALLPMLSAGRVKLALWGPAGDVQEMDPAAFDALLQKLQEQGITPTACLLDLPPPIAERLRARAVEEKSGELGGGESETSHSRPTRNSPLPAVSSSSWPLILRADPADWQPQLAYLISRHANHLDRWQLGDDASDAFVANPKMRQAYGLVYREFAKLVQDPDLAMPWPAWYELEGDLPATVAMSVPSAVVLPNQLPLYIQDIERVQGSGFRVQGGGKARPASTTRGSSSPSSPEPRTLNPEPSSRHDLSLSLDWLDRDRYGREVQLRDAAQRVIYALSADARRVDLPLPFVVRRGEDGSATKEPDEMLLVLRTVISTLGGTTYKGRVPIADGVEAFLFDRDGRGILALWDRGGRSSVRELALNLGERPVSIGLRGNVTPLLRKATDTVGGKPLAPGEVKLLLGPDPIFLVDVDGQLAQTRASVAIDRPLIESSFEPHTRHVRFTNCYREAIGGTLRLRPPANWTVTPPTFQFTLNPGETFDKEVRIEIPYNSVAGPKTINAEFAIQGERNVNFTVPITVSLGLSDVGMQTTAVRDGRDIVVQQMVTNYGDKSIDYSAFASLPGQQKQERLISGLGAGKATVKRYRFVNVSAPPGAKVKVGLKELVGTRILNDEVVVP